MARLILLTILISYITPADLFGDPFDGLEYQSESVATASFVTSGAINPAGLAYISAMGAHYSHSFTDSTYKGDDALLISSRKGFFGIEWLNHSTNLFRRKYTLSIGDRLSSNFYMGFSLSWFNGNDLYKKKRSYRLGILYHPFPELSLGLVADRLNEPAFSSVKSKRLYRPGIAYRPFGKKITVSTDARWIEGESLSGSNVNFRIETRPVEALHLTAEYETEGMWKLGITYDFNKTKVGGQVRTKTADGYSGGSYFFELGALSYSPAIGRAKTGFISLDGDIVEEPSRNVIFGPSRKSFFNVISALRKGADNPKVNSLFIRYNGARLSLASAQELREAIKVYREKGKRVTVYINSGGNIAYYLASAADEIYMNPSGYLDLRGISATATFYKGTMEKLGINAQVIRTGPHKTFADPFTETGLTDSAREQLNWLLDDLYDQFVTGIADGRRMSVSDVSNIIDSGPYTARDAYAAGLVDGLVYYEDLMNEHGFDSGNFVNLYNHFNRNFYNDRWSEPKSIAIVYADGSIRPGKSGRSILDGKAVGSGTLASALRQIRKDKSISSAVIRVNSPGGDLFASEEIYRQMELLSREKPLVVSMGRTAASGGYYISMAADEIMASPGTVTGSIGVVVGKPDLSGFYEKIGITKEVVRRGRHSDIRSFNRPATDDEIDLIEKQVGQYYDDFITKVAAWRKMDRDSVEAVAGGRVWTGRQAMANGLIDSYGGIWDAVELARDKAGIDKNEKLDLKIFPRHRFSFFSSPFGLASGEGVLDILDVCDNAEFKLKLPYDLKIE